MKDNNSPHKLSRIMKDIVPMALAQIIIVILMCLGAWVLHICNVIEFNLTIVWGALLGAVVTLVNYIFMTMSVDKAINNYLAIRGDKEMDEEEAEKFASENSMPIQNAIKTSYIIRTVSMLVTLVIAFLTNVFNPITTAIPLLTFRPLLSVIESIKGKVAK